MNKDQTVGCLAMYGIVVALLAAQLTLIVVDLVLDPVPLAWYITLGPTILFTLVAGAFFLYVSLRVTLTYDR